MEFIAITTQEQFDAAISERLKRERETMEKRFEGFLSPEDVAKKYDGYLAPSDIEKKYAGYLTPEAAQEKDKKIKSYETNSVKMRIAHEAGLPFELAARLSGENEDDIKADAAQLSKLIGSGHKSPLKDTEPPAGDDKIAALRSLTQNLTKGE